MTCLIKPDMHHSWLCIVPCLCLCIYRVVCFFPVLLLSSGNVAIVRIRSTTSACLLHGLVLLPCGISGKMTATLDLTTIIAMLVASFYRYAALPIFAHQASPNCHEPLTFDTFPMQTVVWLCYRFAQPSYSVASCRWSWRFLHGGHDFCWDITISLILLMHLYTW